MGSFGWGNFKQRPVKALGLDTINGINGFVGQGPLVYIHTIYQRGDERHIFISQEIMGVFAQYPTGSAQVTVLVIHPVGLARGKDIQLGAVAVEESRGKLTFYGFLRQLSHPVNGKLWLDELIEIEHGWVVQRIVYTA